MARRKEMLNPAAVRAAMKRVGITDSAELARRSKNDESNISRWINAKRAPDALHLAQLCVTLGASPAELLALKDFETDVKAQVIDVVRHVLGEPEAAILRSLSSLTPSERSRIADKVMGWAEHAREQQQPPPSFPYDDERGVIVSEPKKLGGAVAPPPVGHEKPAKR